MDLADRPSFPASQVLGRCASDDCSGPVVNCPQRPPRCYSCAEPYPERNPGEDRGDPFVGAGYRSMSHRLGQMDPEDLGLSPLGGTIAGP